MSEEQAIVGELLPVSRRGANLVGSRRRFKLTSARGVRRELASVYAELRNNEIDADTARTAAFVLRCVLESIRIDEIEQRLVAVEKRTGR